VDSPLEITEHEFSRVFRGYNTDEVDSYLELVGQKMLNLQKKVDELKRENEVSQLELKKYQTVENALHETLVETRKNADMIRKAAEKEAELILERAEEEAKKKVMSLQGVLSKITREVEDLEQRRLDYISKLRSLAERQLSLLAFYEESDHPQHR